MNAKQLVELYIAGQRIFCNADLSYGSLASMDLQGVDLWQATLVKADLGGTNLARANLREAVLIAANLSHANLSSVESSKPDRNRILQM